MHMAYVIIAAGIESPRQIYAGIAIPIGLRVYIARNYFYYSY